MCQDLATTGLPPRGQGAGRARHESKILLIEDDEELRKLLVQALVRDGHSVIALADGDQALDWLGLCLFDGTLTNVPALIISDVRLPQFSGLELLEGLVGAQPDVPVILITAFPSAETYAEAFELGAERVLAKPFDLDALRIAVQNVLETRSAPATRHLFQRSPGWTKWSV